MSDSEQYLMENTNIEQHELNQRASFKFLDEVQQDQKKSMSIISNPQSNKSPKSKYNKQSTENLMMNIEANRNNLNIPISGRLAETYQVSHYQKNRQQHIMDNYGVMNPNYIQTLDNREKFNQSNSQKKFIMQRSSQLKNSPSQKTTAMKRAGKQIERYAQQFDARQQARHEYE